MLLLHRIRPGNQTFFCAVGGWAMGWGTTPGVCLPRPEGMLRGGWAAMFSWPRYPGAGIKWLPVPDAGSAQAGDASLSIAGGLSSPGPLGSREGGWGLASEGLFGGLISSMKRRLCLWTVVLCVFGVLSLVLCPQRACQRALLLLRWAEVCWPPFERPESLCVLPSRTQMAPVETFKALNQ